MQNEVRNSDFDNVNHAVTCNVDKCIYNNGHMGCTAQTVTVKQRMALLGEETKCETFTQVQ